MPSRAPYPLAQSQDQPFLADFGDRDFNLGPTGSGEQFLFQVSHAAFFVLANQLSDILARCAPVSRRDLAFNAGFENLGQRDEEEVFTSRKENVHVIRRYLFVPGGKTRCARRNIPLTENAIGVLKQRLRKSRGQYLFWNKCDRDKPLTEVCTISAIDSVLARLWQGLTWQP